MRFFQDFLIVESFDFALINPEDNPDHPYERRTCAVARIQAEDTLLTVATAHKSYSSAFVEDQDKIDETKKLIECFKQYPENLIFTGDFNLPPESTSLQMLEKELQHCGPDYSQATRTTKPFSFMGFEEKELRWRLDYVFASKNIKVLSSQIIATEWSDHLPVLVECEF